MMDNFEQARLLKNLDDIHQINFPEKTEFFDRVDKFDVRTQNFNFGANIVSPTTMPSSTVNTSSSSCSNNEEEIKTNAIKDVKTITDELEISSSIPDTTQANHDSSGSEEQGNSECTGEAEDEEDSYQTDDNDNSQLSQEEMGCLVQTSKDYADEEDEDNPDEDSDDSSSDSDFSDLSGLSDMSGREWKPINQRPLNWVQKQIHSGVNPREILSKFLPSSAQRISPELNDMTLWRILASMLSEPPRRKKLSYVNTFEDVIDLVKKSKNIIVLTGAGVSVSCGIPDFRSSDGIYSRLAKDFPNLPDPQAMFDINYFSRDPRPFYKFAREIYPGQFKPSPCHRFIKMLEQKQKLLRNYTQNIDTLEQVAGIQNVIECHGSFSTASCTKCKYKCDADSIRADIFAQRIPVCPRCQPNVEQSVDASQPVSEMELRLLVENGIMKPDIVFFGEGLPDEFHTVMGCDKDKCDLLIVMGSSLKVRPVALIPSSIPNHVPQILINREQLHHLEFDVELLGDGDVIINQICHRLGDEWKDICFNDEILQESHELTALDDEEDYDEEEEKEIQASTDNDSLSIKSSQSTDLMLHSGTTCSDSGFESSSTSSKKDGEFLPPDYLEEPMESNGFGGSCDYRHLSIDSSKDSGILGDASNSALPPVFNSFSETGDLKKSLNMPASTTQAISNKTVDTLHSTKTVDSNCTEAEKQSIRRQQRHQSAADRLHSGTYYAHDLTASYVFPGAQVSWSSDDEADDDDDLNCGNEGKHLDDGDDDYETNHAPLSPLMTPSVENEMVKAITSNTHASTSSSFANVISSNATIAPPSSSTQQKKRHSTETEECANVNENEDLIHDGAASATASMNSPPPQKKRRDSTDVNISAVSSTCTAAALLGSS